MKKIITVLSMAAFAACGGSSPKNYVGSVDLTGWAALPATCATSSTPANTNTVTATDINDPLDFSIWQSGDGKSTVLQINGTGLSGLFSDVTSAAGGGTGGAGSFQAAPSLTMNSTDGKVFTSGEVSKYSVSAAATFTDTSTLTITFPDTSYAKGTISLSASRVSSGEGAGSADIDFNCAPPELPFIAGAVQGNNVVNYTESTNN